MSEYRVVRNDELMHKKVGAKYVKREKVGDKWRYWYKEDLEAEKNNKLKNGLEKMNNKIETAFKKGEQKRDANEYSNSSAWKSIHATEALKDGRVGDAIKGYAKAAGNDALYLMNKVGDGTLDDKFLNTVDDVKKGVKKTKKKIQKSLKNSYKKVEKGRDAVEKFLDRAGDGAKKTGRKIDQKLDDIKYAIQEDSAVRRYFRAKPGSGERLDAYQDRYRAADKRDVNKLGDGRLDNGIDRRQRERAQKKKQREREKAKKNR